MLYAGPPPAEKSHGQIRLRLTWDARKICDERRSHFVCSTYAVFFPMCDVNVQLHRLVFVCFVLVLAFFFSFFFFFVCVCSCLSPFVRSFLCSRAFLREAPKGMLKRVFGIEIPFEGGRVGAPSQVHILIASISCFKSCNVCTRHILL